MAHTEPFDLGDRTREVVKERGLDSVDELVRNIDPFGDGLDRIAQPINDAYDDTYHIDGEAFPLFRFIKGMPLAMDASGDRRSEGVVEVDRLVGNYIDAIVDKEDFNGAGDFEQGGDRLFIGVPSVHTVGLYGMDAWRSRMPPAPDPLGDRNAAEMVDVYIMEQLRDVPFVEWPNEMGGDGIDDIPQQTLDAIEADLDDIGHEFGDWWYGPDRLFVEADTDEIDWGPYLSQFLIQDLQLWALNAQQTYLRHPETNYNSKQSEWLDLIEGKSEYAAETNPKKPDSEDQGYIATPRHLATIVNAEPPFQEYFIAAIQLLDGGFADNLPFTTRDEGRVFAYNETGPVGMLDMLTRAARQALLAAFYHKWRIHFRCRPETYSGRIHEQRAGNHQFGIPDLITDAAILGERSPDTDYLTSSYIEGSPVHPAYPSGHSVIAGACGTVLKTWFPDSDELPFDQMYVPTPDGDRRETVEVPEGHTGVFQEIDKLMSNVGLARLYAGVHYYSDHYRGIKLGEQVAVGMMVDIFRREYDADEEIRPTFKPYLEYDDSAELEVSLDTLNQLRHEAASRDANALWPTS